MRVAHLLLISVLLLCSTEAWSASKKLPSKSTDGYLWKEDYLRGMKMLRSPRIHVLLSGAKLLLGVHKKAPNHFKTLEAACMAYVNLSRQEKNNKKAKDLAYKGWKIATQFTKLYPKRAEGYYWAALLIGIYGNRGGVWAAIRLGVASKLRKNCEKAIRLNPKLYKGRVQRLLGRFFFKLPWPMRRLKRSIRYLKKAYKLNPKHILGNLYLGEALHDNGKKRKAYGFFKRCSIQHAYSKFEKKQKSICNTWLQKYAKAGL